MKEKEEMLMPNHENVRPDRVGTPQALEVIRAIQAQLGPMVASGTPDQAEAMMRNQARVGRVIRAALTEAGFFSPPADPAEVARKEWTWLYQDIFKKTVDLSKVRVPTPRLGFPRLIFVAQELGNKPISRVIESSCTLFPTRCSWDDPDHTLLNERNNEQTYAIWCREVDVPDYQLREKSSRDLWKRDVKTMTLLERLLYGLKYFMETGRQLDVGNAEITYCSGSRSLKKAQGLFLRRGCAIPTTQGLPSGRGLIIGPPLCDVNDDYSSNTIGSREVVAF